MKEIKIVKYPNGEFKAMFDTRLSAPGTPDHGRRVKHTVVRTKNNDGIVHMRHFLTSCMEPDDSQGFYVTKRKFWGKVRAVELIDSCLDETIFILAVVVKEFQKIERNREVTISK